MMMARRQASWCLGAAAAPVGAWDEPASRSSPLGLPPRPPTILPARLRLVPVVGGRSVGRGASPALEGLNSAAGGGSGRKLVSSSSYLLGRGRRKLTPCVSIGEAQEQQLLVLERKQEEIITFCEGGLRLAKAMMEDKL